MGGNDGALPSGALLAADHASDPKATCAMCPQVKRATHFLFVGSTLLKGLRPYGVRRDVLLLWAVYIVVVCGGKLCSPLRNMALQ